MSKVNEVAETYLSNVLAQAGISGNNSQLTGNSVFDNVLRKAQISSLLNNSIATTGMGTLSTISSVLSGTDSSDSSYLSSSLLSSSADSSTDIYAAYNILNALGSSTQSSSSTSSGTSSLESIFQKAASQYGVSSKLLKAIAKQESGFQADVTSASGAMGIMQLMPGTASSLGVSDPYDAEQNIMGGAKLIASLLDQYDNDLSLALAAYNAGTGAVEKYGGVPPYTETKNYIKNVLAILQEDEIDLSAAGTTTESTSSADTLLSLLGLTSDTTGISSNSQETMSNLAEMLRVQMLMSSTSSIGSLLDSDDDD